jgi:hypothetical protein
MLLLCVLDTNIFRFSRWGIIISCFEMLFVSITCVHCELLVLCLLACEWRWVVMDGDGRCLFVCFIQVADGFSPDLTFTSEPPLVSPTRSLKAFDQLSATFQYNTSNNSGSVTAPLVKGAPYITVEYAAAAAAGSSVRLGDDDDTGDGVINSGMPYPLPVLTSASAFTKISELSLAEEARGLVSEGGISATAATNEPQCSEHPG